MIDFRYHIVSIVSIFLALAVGILLGAGPLQEDLGKTLSSQVETLRQEKSDLRAQLDTVQKQLDAGNEFATEVTPALVGSRLGGRSIALVTLPGTDKDVVAALTEVLTAAGATVNGPVGVTTSWTDPAKRSVREQLSTDPGPDVGTGGTSSTGSTAGTGDTGNADAGLNARLGALLARALVVSKLTDAGRRSLASKQTLARLKQADLVTFDADGPAASTLAVLVAPSPDAEQGGQRSAEVSAWTALARALDSASSGSAVVAASKVGGSDSAATGGLLAAIRADDGLAKVVSTVDHVGTAVGRIAAVYALREQMAGGAGQYGVGPGASAVVPVLTVGGA